MSGYTMIKRCRACENDRMQSVLDLGSQPLANRFLAAEAAEEDNYHFGIKEPTYPLHLVRCLTCGLAQLDVVVDPKILYGAHYPYRSGYSEGWRKHCAELAAEIGPDKRVLDIGCLDGTLLEILAGRGMCAWGCDPSAPESHLYPVVRELFTRDFRLAETKFDVIVAQNVFGHVDDAKGFLEGVAENLAPNGHAIIEVPWVVPLICEGRWDTIYHEHVTAWSIGPIRILAEKVGLRVARVRHFPDLHGGTIRVYLDRPPSPAPLGHIPDEHLAEGLTVEDFQRFAIRAMGDIRRWDKWFDTVQQRSVAAYGASAKFSVFTNALPRRAPISGVFDDNPAKHNLYTPGCHYPVLKPTKTVMREVDILLVGASNWKDEILEKARGLGFSGEVVSLW